MATSLIPGEYRELPKRGISEETCKKFHYQWGEMNGRACQIANYFDPDGDQVVAQKIRFPDKTFTITGDMKQAGLYGQSLWRDKGKMITVVEGEIDALSLSQMQGNKWPVVSVNNGAPAAKKAVAKNLEWLLGFDHIIFMFDNDEPGRAAAVECAEILPPGRAKIATLPLKDANEMLVAGRAKETIDAMWGAKVYRPDGVVTIEDVKDTVLLKPETGLPWFLPTLSQYTYGRRMGECYGIGAGTGVGKTDFLTQQIEFDLTLGEKVGLFFFEQQPVETVKRIAGKRAAKRFHIPQDAAGWTQEELEATVQSLQDGPGLFLYDSFGAIDWEVVQSRIRYLAHSEGIRIFYLDHLTALAAALDDERRGLDQMMAEMGSLVIELNICLTFVSHLATPEGRPHEEGGRVMLKHLRGSRAIVQWAHFVFGLERNQQAESIEPTTVRILKDRYTGNATGKTVEVSYDKETGILSEGGASPFAPSGEKVTEF